MKEGSWGASTMAKPSILCHAGTPVVSSCDSRNVLNNGKHIIQALKDVLASYSDPQVIDEEEWCVGDLFQTFTTGVYVDFVEYPEDDRDRQVAMQVHAHEQEQNKFRPSSIADKVGIVLRLHAKSAGGDWVVTNKTLLSILGGTKVSTCYRWVCLARDLDADVLGHIKVKRKELAVTYVSDNKCLLGRGESARYKLTPTYAKAALDRLFDVLDAGKTISSKDFFNDYCMPLKTLESWEKQQVSKFGQVARDFPAFQRLIRSLQTENGRQKLCLCVSQRLPISGTENSTAYGIEEARAVVMEMQKMKAGADSTKHPAQLPEAAAGEALTDQQPASQPKAPGDTMEVDDGDLLLEEEETPVDPILLKAESLADAEATYITVHIDRDEFKRDIQSRLLSHHKPLFIVEAPTSKAKIYNDLLKFVNTLGHKDACFFIPVGTRTDLLSTVMATLRKDHPKRPLFIIQFGNETQTQHTRSNFGIFMPAVGAATSNVPCFVSLSGCRAKHSEGLRLRCTDPQCSMRDKAELEAQDAGDPDAADACLHEDDQEFGEFDMRDSVEEDDIDEAELAMAAAAEEDHQQGKGQGRFKRNLFPFASPVAVHNRILNQVLRASSFSHAIILTRSSHPGLYLAARECNLQVVVMLEGSRSHCVAHGQVLLRRMLVGKNYQAAKAQVGGSGSGSVKRVRGCSLPFIVVEAPPKEEQVIRMREVDPDPNSAWRLGFNKRPLSMEEKMVNLLQKELCEHSLSLEKQPDGKIALFTISARREGEILCPLRGLAFDSLPSLEGFLSEGGNKILSDRIVRVDGVVLDEAGGVSPVYVVLTGIGRYIQHFVGVRRSGPNAKILVDSTAGAGDGFLSIRAATRNSAGIAARSQVVLNFGNEFDMQYKPDFEETAAKKFCGALDAYFQRERVSGAVPPEEAEEKKKEEEAKNKEEGAKTKEEEAKKKEEAAAKKKEEEAKKKEDAEAKKKEEEAKKKEEAAKKKDEHSAAAGATCGTELASQKLPFPFTLQFQEGEAGQTAAQLRIVSQADGNKKLPPRTVLWILKAGGGVIQAQEEGKALTWSFKNTKTPLSCTCMSVFGSLWSFRYSHYH